MCKLAGGILAGVLILSASALDGPAMAQGPLTTEADAALLAGDLAGELDGVVEDAADAEVDAAMVQRLEAFSDRAAVLASDLAQGRPKAETVRQYRELQAIKRELIGVSQLRGDEGPPLVDPASVATVQELLGGLAEYYEER